MTHYVLMVKAGNMTLYWTGKGHYLTNDRMSAKTWKTQTGAFKARDKAGFTQETFISER